MKLRLIAAVIFFVIPGLSYLNADVYRWTDGRGNVSYGNQPPSDARDIKLMFKETASAPGPGGAVREEEQRNAETIIKELENEERRKEEEARQKVESAKRSAPLSRDERIAAEKVRLEKTIAELEEKPLDYFGSQKNKRVRIGYYQYRLDTLMTNSDEYFATPESFEGNVKTSETQK
jgi:type IV secretory pathway VirB10-like protein